MVQFRSFLALSDLGIGPTFLNREMANLRPANQTLKKYQIHQIVNEICCPQAFGYTKNK